MQLRIVRICLGALLAIGSQASAQGPPSEASAFFTSPYLPLGHWAYEYLDILVARGKLPGMAALVQPYRRVDIAGAAQAARAQGALTPQEERWVDEVERELAHELMLLNGARSQELRFRGMLGAGLKLLTDTHRDPLRPEGDAAAFPTVELTLVGDAPNIVGALRLRWDGQYVNDPQFPGERVIPFRECDPIVAECAYRVEDGYVEVQLPYVRLFLGRTYRNWGLPGTQGFLVANYAYSYDHVAYRFGGERLALSGLFAPLNDFRGDTARYFSSHRLDWRIRDNLLLSVGESVIYGGVNRRVDLNLVNPVGVWEISPSGDAETNTLGLAEVWWRPGPGITLYGGLLVDNTRVGEEGEASGLTQWGSHFGVQLPALTPTVAVRADLAIANSLAYRSRVDRSYYYTFDGLGLGRDISDAVIASLQGTWFAGAKLVLKPRVGVMWRGEDDIRLPWPSNAFTGHDLLLVGTVETTVRPSLGGRWRLPYGEAAWDVGLNFVRNEGNAPRGWRAKPVGRLTLEVRP